MLYHIFEYFEEHYSFPGAGLFEFLTFRAGVAIILSLIISIVFGQRLIRYLKRMQIGESVRDLGLDGQKQKEGTPTMGGIIIFLAIMIPCLLIADLTNIYIQLLLLSTLWMALIGFIDDYIKVFLKNKKGLSGKFKIMGQIVLGLIVGVTMVSHDDVVVRMQVEEANRQGFEIVERIGALDRGGQMVEMAYVKTTLTNVPFSKGNLFDYTDLLFFLGENASTWVWIIFVPVIIFIVTAVSNGANLTDGLDGLATGVSAIIAGTLGILAYVSGNTIFADYLNILYLPNTGELIVFSACLLGACVGFLWYNAYPAKVFMGDTGSLMLGGVIAALAVVIRKELLIPILCGIFLIESLSVVLQVTYFRYTRKTKGVGKRIFLMAPIHHHYQKQGMHEAKIVTRFWIVAIMCAILTIITLKLR